MTHANNDHPMHILRNGSKELQERAALTEHQAKVQAKHAGQAMTDLANLDLEELFAPLRQMVEMIGGKSRHAARPSTQASYAMAAE